MVNTSIEIESVPYNVCLFVVFLPFFVVHATTNAQAESRAAALGAKAASLGDDLRAKTAELEDALAAAERGDRAHAELARALQGELLGAQGALAECEERVHAARRVAEPTQHTNNTTNGSS